MLDALGLLSAVTLIRPASTPESPPVDRLTGHRSSAVNSINKSFFIPRVRRERYAEHKPTMMMVGESTAGRVPRQTTVSSSKFEQQRLPFASNPSSQPAGCSLSLHHADFEPMYPRSALRRRIASREQRAVAFARFAANHGLIVVSLWILDTTVDADPASLAISNQPRGNETLAPTLTGRNLKNLGLK
jgi:hypothetical protein